MISTNRQRQDNLPSPDMIDPDGRRCVKRLDFNGETAARRITGLILGPELHQIKQGRPRRGFPVGDLCQSFRLLKHLD